MVWRWLWRLGPGNPVLVRIVQTGSRQQTHQWVRSGYLAALILLVLISLLSGQAMGDAIRLTDLAKNGAAIFRVVAYGQVILICLLAPLFLSGAIASQRQGQTYDILLTTPLSNLQIVLGSLLGRLFFVWALLLGGLPLFAVVLIFGGVPVESVWIAFALAGLWALLLGTVAVALSVRRRGGRKAVFVFVIVVASYLVAGYVGDVLLFRRMALTPGTTTWLTPLHPLLVLEASLASPDYQVPPLEQVAHLPGWWQVYLTRPMVVFSLLCVVVSLVLMGVSAIQLRRWGTEPRGWVARLGDRLGGRGPRGAREVWHNPIAWREAGTRGRRLVAWAGRWAFVIAGLLAGAGLLLGYHRDALPTIHDASKAALPGYAVFHYSLLVLLLIEVAVVTLVAIYISASSVSREREDGTLDLILTTPITPRQYIWGKLRGLVSFLSVLGLVPILTLAMVSLYVWVGRTQGWPQVQVDLPLPVGAGAEQAAGEAAAGAAGTSGAAPGTSGGGGSGAMGGRFDLVLPEAGLLLAGMLLPFVAMCVMVGMTFSLRARGVMKAVAPTVGTLGGLAVFGGFCGWTAAENIPLVGPAINAFSPVTNLVMIIMPWDRVSRYVENPSLGRASLAVAALVAAVGYSLVVYALLGGMVNNFDQAVRQDGQNEQDDA